MANKPNFQQAEYLKSALTMKDWPLDQGREIGFIGRSNAGKSSALNAITHNRQLARTSKTPGRTQMVNFFTLNDPFRLVDLPGYGFAKVPLAIKKRWQANINHYLQMRQSLCGLIIVVDIRHTLKPVDIELVSWAQEASLPCHILLTKADKLSNNQQHQAQQQTAKQLASLQADKITYQAFSSLDKQGIKPLICTLNDFFLH